MGPDTLHRTDLQFQLTGDHSQIQRRQWMMDVSVRVMFVLLLISLQLTGGDFNKPPGSSKISRFFKKLFSKSPKDKSNNVQGANEHNSYLEWVASTEVPKDAVSVKDDQGEYYIAKLQQQCKPCFFEKTTRSCLNNTLEAGKMAVSYNDVMFLVNKDNFEIYEWKKYNDRKLPHMFIELCDEYFVLQNFEGDRKNDKTEILTLNTEYKMQRLKIIEYFMSSVVMSENLEVLKHFQASNRNCNSSKHTVKFDQNIDKTGTYQTGKTRTSGVYGDISVTGKIPQLFEIAGKLGFKYDKSRSHSNTTSLVDKTLHSVSMEVEVPPNHSCSIDIASNTVTAEIPFTGEMTRTYKNNEIRKTIINSTYTHQEVTEIQTFENPCKPLSEARKC